MSQPAQISMPVQVFYYDTDAGGVVHNLAYLRFIEAARTLLAINLGMDFQLIEKTGIHPVLIRTEADFRKPARLGEHLTIEGHVSEVRGARFWVNFKILRQSNNDLLVECRQALALVKLPEGHPVRIATIFPALAPAS